ncbi:DegT/DnrJ/EryC1/StrS family aminotransferase [Nocardiopsis dassonvillei]|uniref:DegT/DnrJ/EryC1/StrS family aminotransferase n=1 Tax=Nocardiopsis dassonvillei TaxID=2014 RepID=UPI002010893A|nr:DegT/DnrJ/EryC1/StrS family aminotransferase [Nocardiopsis dassonvillei]MCK9868090.1 DegT/DnrJ/EryC1/StrS family aminotransferase [Nocardiopsis dassonvillei]
MTINVWGYLDEYAKERDDILDAVDTVFRSGNLILGESVRGFEEAFAAYQGVAHCVSVDNGTNAIALALRALGVGPGDEVVTVSNTAAPTVLAIDSVGAVPVFVDIDPETYLMDLDGVEAVLTERTRCLLPVHLYGQCVDMDRVNAIAARHGLLVLEDCAQAHGARSRGRVAGSMGHAAAFSFYPTKVLGAYGDGGAVVTDDPEVDARLRRLRYYGMEDRYYVVETPGFNSRLDEVQAEILRRRLARLDDYVDARQRIAKRYEEGLAGSGIVPPTTAPDNSHVYYLYVARHPGRDRIIDNLRSHSISLNASYRWPVHTMTGFAHLGYARGSLPVTERRADEIFSLPMYPSLAERDQERVIQAIHEVVRSL